MMNSIFVLILFSWTSINFRVNSQECQCNQIPSIEIVNDENLAAGIKQVRDDFLSKQQSAKFNRLSATILIRENKSQKWRRGSVDGTKVDYPASTVKLMYMYAAMEWCKNRTQPIDCLDRYVRPMVVDSSNLDTGYVVDAITNTTNIDDLNSINDTRWEAWFYQRLLTERLLKSLNMYENQIVRSKTYPTNSGQSPIGSESVLRRTPYQSNVLQSCCTASFILYLMQTRPNNEIQYMKSMLYRSLDKGDTTFGNGLPAGTILYGKPGNAYDTVEEIAYIILPDGQEIVLSAFSNGFQRPDSDFYILGRFAEMVLSKFSLVSSLSTIIFTADDASIFTCTNDSVKYSTPLPKDTIGQSLIIFNNSCIIHPTLSQRGVYTVSIWNPSYFDSFTSNNNYRMNVAVTDAYNFTDGDDGYIYDQKKTASRWIQVGDFLLNPGKQNVYLKSLNQISVFNAIRFSIHPPLTTNSRSSTNSSGSIFSYIFYFIFLINSIFN